MSNIANEIAENSIFIREIVSYEKIVKATRLDSFEEYSKCIKEQYLESQKEIDKNSDLDSLLSVIEFIEKNIQNNSLDKAKNSERIPFFELFLPFSNYIKEEMLNSKYSLPNFLIESLLSQYSEYISWLAGITLLEEFEHFKLNNESKEKYNAYIQFMLNEGLLLFLRKYPILTRLITTATTQFVVHVKNIFDRLEKDNLKILDKFHEDVAISNIQDISLGLSDRHNGGQTVAIIRFSSGFEIVYKPRSVSMEQAFFKLIHEINIQNSKSSLFSPKIISCNDYGWVEVIKNQDCNSSKEVANYYYQSGQLLFLVHILNGTDCHDENIIANVSSPVLIDAETLFHSNHTSVEASEHDDAYHLGLKTIISSVLRTGWLPSWQFSGTNVENAYETGAIASEFDHSSPYRVETWKNIGTDNIKVSFNRQTISSNQRNSLPSLNGEKIGISAYVQELVSGYESMGNFVLNNKELFKNWVKTFFLNDSSRSRFILRNTTTYALILKHLRTPLRLRNGLDSSIFLENLIKPVFGNKSKELNIIISYEIMSLYKLDVPYLTTSLTSTKLNEESIQRFSKSAYENSVARIDELSEKTISFDSRIIWQILYASIIDDGHYTVEGKVRINNLDKINSSKINYEVNKLLNKLLQFAIYGSNSTITWIAAQNIPLTKKFQIQPLTSGIYEGLGGIAISYAASGKILNNKSFKEVSRNILNGIPEYFKHNYFEPDKQLCGIGHGVGSSLYTISVIEQLIGTGMHLGVVQNALNLVKLEWIDSQQEVDLINGLSGLLLALLKVYEIFGLSEALDKAIYVRKKIMSLRNGSSSNSLWNSTVENKTLTGFSHGLSGIVRALSETLKFDHSSEVIEVIKTATQFENNCFDASEGQWPDPRVPENFVGPKDQLFRSTWCYGAPGIGLSRIALMKRLNDENYCNDLDRCVRSSINALDNQHDYIDHLCCGNLGRIELLIEAGIFLNSDELIYKAGQYAMRLIEVANIRGGYKLSGLAPEIIFNPGLFQGISGIALQLLRASNPKDIPSISSFN
jgi:type 2 lantibiotic biosynthesis protein LanM